MDDGQQLGQLMTRATDFTAPPPPVSVFADQRRQRRRVGLSALAAMCVVVAVVASVTAVSVVRSHRSSVSKPTLPVLPKVTVADLAKDHWSQLPPAPIVGRSDAAAVWTGKEMVVWGGSSTSDDEHYRYYADGAAYNPIAETWRRLASSPLTARVAGVSVWAGSKLFVWGGSTGGTGFAHDGATYDPVKNRWKKLPPVLLDAEGQLQAIWTGTEAIVFDLSAGQSVERVTATSYSPRTNRWHSLPPMPAVTGHDLFGFQALLTGNSIYLIARWMRDAASASDGSAAPVGDDGYTLALPTMSWSRNALTVGNTTDVTRALWTGSRVLFPASPFAGPYSSPPDWSNPAVLVDPATGEQQPVTAGPLNPLVGSYVWTGDAALLFDSRGSRGLVPAGPAGLSTAWNPDTNRWTRLPSAPLGGFVAPAAVWAGTRLLVWGQMYAPDAAVIVPTTGGIEFGR
jgi:hypothetical protein